MRETTLTKFCGTTQRRFFSVFVLVAITVTFITIKTSIESVKYSIAAQAILSNKEDIWGKLRTSTIPRETEKIISSDDENSNEEDILVKLQEQAELIQQLQKTIGDCGSQFIAGTQLIFEKQEEANQSPFAASKQDAVVILQQQTELIKQLDQQLQDQKAIISEISEEFQNLQDYHSGQPLKTIDSSMGLTTTPQQSSRPKSQPDTITIPAETSDNGTVQPSTAYKSGVVAVYCNHEIRDTTSTVSTLQGNELSRYADSSDPLVESDIPVFWHIPKSGGSSIKDIMGSCHRLTMASEAGILDGHADDTQLAIVNIGGDPANGIEPSKFVNLDTTSVLGLEKAKQLDLANSGLADVIVIRHLFEAEDIFHVKHRGRVFAIFRHPVDRSVSMFNYIKFADWESTYNAEIAKMSLEEYVNSPFMEQDWLTRYLSNTMEGPLGFEHVELAKDTLRRKVLVGLLEKKEESMERFEKFFGWKYKARPQVQEECRVEYLKGGVNSNTHSKEKPQPGSPLYDKIVHMNMFDIMLYCYVEQLFEEQAKLTVNIPNGYRLEGATCCECKSTC